jgi:hypothetical protein
MTSSHAGPRLQNRSRHTYSVHMHDIPPTCSWIQRSASLHLEGFQLFTGVPLEAASPLEPAVIDTETHQFENP